MTNNDDALKKGPWYLYLIMEGVQRLPLHFALRLGSFLGLVTYFVWRQRTTIALNNLEKVWGKSKSRREIRGIAKRMYQNLGKGLIEFFRLPLLTMGNLTDTVSIEGMKNLRSAHDQGRGVFLLSGHFGNWEMLSAAISLSGIPMNVLVKKIRNPPIDRFVNGIRRDSGVNPIEKQDGGKEMIGRLKKNEAVGFVLDQHATEGVTVNFFSQGASTYKGLALLARRYKVPIVPVFMIREKQGYHKLVFEPALKLCTGKNANDSIVDDTQQCMDVLERFIRNFPEQWIWLHRRWKK